MADLRQLLSDAAGGPPDPFDPDAVRQRVRQRAARRRAAGGLAAVALAGLVAVGVVAQAGDPQHDGQVVAVDPDPPTSTTSTTTATTVAAPTPTTTAVPDPDPGPTTTTTLPTTTTTTVPAELDDGRHFGYLVGAEPGGGGATIAVFDLAQWFEGDEADRAAQEDGAVGPGEEIENDVYIRNESDQLRRVPFDPAVAVTVVDCEAGCESRTADLATLLARPRPTPVWLEVVGGEIVAADEQYLP